MSIVIDGTAGLSVPSLSSGSTVTATTNIVASGTLSVTGTSTLGTVLPSATNTVDMGSTSARWRNIYTNDLHLSNGIGDYTIVEGEDELFLYNNKKGKVYKFALIEVDPTEAPAKAKVE
jgi:hypothetical protein